MDLFEYDPSHKTSSVSTSSSSGDIWDSLYSESLLQEGIEFRQGSKEDEPKPSSVLTLDQKRKNHIASEQKRRNTIKEGFAELNDIIPTCSGSSKSMILFKSVEYIKQLDKRNKRLRERLAQLQEKVKVKQKQKSKKNRQHLESLKEQLKLQQALLIKHNIIYSPKALIIPSDDHVPCFHIPADDENEYIY